MKLETNSTEKGNLEEAVGKASELVKRAERRVTHSAVRSGVMEFSHMANLA